MQEGVADEAMTISILCSFDEGCVMAVWLIGRGASIACNLGWVVPNGWHKLDRNIKIERIKGKIREEMESPNIDTRVYKDFLKTIMNHTAPDVKHCFITTNWDYLLQKEIDALVPTSVPECFSNSHVYHLNGTVEKLNDNTNRSPFLLEEDPVKQRIKTIEANQALNTMLWEKLFVVVGMSFECQTDKFLIHTLNEVEDHMPIGESKWLLVNNDKETLERSASLIQKALPKSTIVLIEEKFGGCVKNKMYQELSTCGVLTF